MVSRILAYVDLFSLLWAWLYQWGSILSQIFLRVLAHVESSTVVTSSYESWHVLFYLGLPSSSRFWYITVSVGLSGILMTNILGVMHYLRDKRDHRDNRLFLCVLAAFDLETPYLVATESHDYAKGGSPDLRALRRRNALWRGLPSAAVSVFVATRGVTQTTVCQHILQMQMILDPILHDQVVQDFKVQDKDVFPKLSHGKDYTLPGSKSGNSHYFGLAMARLLSDKFGEEECPAAQRQLLSVTTHKEYMSTTGMLAARIEDVQQFKDITALQVALRELVADLVSQAITDTALEPFGYSPPKLDRLIMDTENNVRDPGFGTEVHRLLVVKYSNPQTSLLLLQAMFQVAVAVRGLANFVRQQQRLSLMATTALYVHVFLEALLTIGCLVILFTIMPTQDGMDSFREKVIRVIKSIINGPMSSQLVRCAALAASWKKDGAIKANEYFDSEVMPTLEPIILRFMGEYFDTLKKAYAPDLTIERDNLVWLIVVGCLLYGVLRGIFRNVGTHVLVTSPVVVLDEDDAEPVSLAVQMAVKTAAVLPLYIFAARTWLTFKVAVAGQLGLLIRYRFVYHIALGVYVAILIISGITVIIHFNRQEDDSGHGAELQPCASPQQGCCAVDRKRHKPALDASATGAVEMEAGEGQGLLSQLAPSYGGCWPANRWAQGAQEGHRGASSAPRRQQQQSAHQPQHPGFCR